MNYSYKIQDSLFRSLSFLMEVIKSEPSIFIYKAHIKEAKKVLELASGKKSFVELKNIKKEDIMWISVEDELPKVKFFHERNPNFLHSKNVIVKIEGVEGWHKAYLCFSKDYPEAGKYWRIPGFNGDWEVTYWQKVINFKEELKNVKK